MNHTPATAGRTAPLPRCDYSDLPTRECAHCPDEHLEPTRLDLLSHAPEAPPPRPTDLATTSGEGGASPRPRPAPRLPVLDFTEAPVHSMFDELTRGRSHLEPHVVRRGDTTWTENHVTQVPALVHQLLGATPAGSGSESGSTSAKSRPAARIECVDTLMLIDGEAGVWVDRLGGDIPDDRSDPAHPGRPIPGSGTIACLQLLHGLHASAPTCGRARAQRDEETRRPTCCDRHLIEHDVRRWWQQARIITGWDTAAYRPWNTCPVCEVRGGLRVRADAYAVEAALCVECRTVWDTADVGLLAMHIRHENLDTEDPAAS